VSKINRILRFQHRHLKEAEEKEKILLNLRSRQNFPRSSESQSKTNGNNFPFYWISQEEGGEERGGKMNISSDTCKEEEEEEGKNLS